MLSKSINYTEKLNSLLETVKCIMTLKDISREKWNECFYDIHLVCTAFPTPLIDKLYDSTKLFLINHVLELLNTILAGGTENLLQNYFIHWTNYSKGVKYLNLLYHYFNKICIKRYNTPKATSVLKKLKPELIPENLEIGKLGFYIWEQNIMIPLKDRIQELLHDETDKVRHSLSLTTTSMNNIAGILHSLLVTQEFSKEPLKLYHDYFEQPFLEKSSENFKREAARFLQESSVSEYITKTLQVFKIEENRIKPFLHDSTYDKLKKLCIQHMVVDHSELLIEEFKAIIKEERQYDMHNIYLLLREHKDGHVLNTSIDIFREHIQSYGFDVIKSLNKVQIHVHFVEELFVVYNKFKSLVEKVFENDASFGNAFRKAFTKVINFTFVKNKPSKSPEYLSKYCDCILNNLSKGISESEMDQKLLLSITILKYIDDKDVFKNYYQLQLAKRLIFQQCQSMDREKEMINKLKKECGVEFTNKMDQMFTDIISSKDLNTEFYQNCPKRKKKRKINQPNITFSVLKTTAWPLSPPESPVDIPNPILTIKQCFDGFYRNKFDGRKLTWCYNLFQGELKLNYLQKKYVVITQMIPIKILLLFEKHNTLNNSEICNLLQLNKEMLNKYLNGLVKCKLLLIDGDNVSLNMAFNQKKSKIYIRDVLLNDKLQRVERKVDYLENDRLEYTQAAIVRVMKVRKELRHYMLVNEILTLPMTFSPTVSLIKKSIEKLIEKGFLERTQNSAGYTYIE